MNDEIITETIMRWLLDNFDRDVDPAWQEGYVTLLVSDLNAAGYDVVKRE